MSRRVLAPFVILSHLSLLACSKSDPAPVIPTTPPNLANGAQLFATVCAQCHGPNAEGVKGRGLPLPTSTFVNANTDAAVIAMIKVGRPPTTEHPAMPPKGGRLDLTDADLYDIVSFVRTLQEPEG